jgi:transcriptional regulator with XRE-family HTH domain
MRRVALPFCHVTLCARKPDDSRYPAALNTVGDHLKKKSLDLGLQQKQAAQVIGVDETTIHNWETNRTEPVIRYIPKIIRFLGYAPYIPAHEFPEKLARARLYLGLSRKTMARLLGKDATTLASWETGKHRPTRKSLALIERLLNYNPRGVSSPQRLEQSSKAKKG